MSLITARADALAALAYDIDAALTPVVVLDCADLAALADGDIAAAARQLAALTAPQLEMQAQAFASYTNAIDPEAELNGADVLAIFQCCIAKHAAFASADRVRVTDPHIVGFGATGTVQSVEPVTGIIFVSLDNEDPRYRSGFAARELARIDDAAPAAPLAIPAILDALVAAVDVARRCAGDDSRWLAAINTGYSWLLQQEVIVFDRATHELTVNSPSGKTYRANGACQCVAFAEHQACWHRAAARLVRRALEVRPAAFGQRLADARATADREEATMTYRLLRGD